MYCVKALFRAPCHQVLPEQEGRMRGLHGMDLEPHMGRLDGGHDIKMHFAYFTEILYFAKFCQLN